MTYEDIDPRPLPELLDELRDIAAKLWPMVDELAAIRYEATPAGRRHELQAVQDSVAEAWCRVAGAVVRVQGVVALDGLPDGPCDDPHAGTCYHASRCRP